MIENDTVFKEVMTIMVTLITVTLVRLVMKNVFVE